MSGASLRVAPGARVMPLLPGLLLLVALAAGATDAELPAEGSSAGNPVLQVAVSIPPQAWFLERLAGERVEGLVLVPPGQSPHVFEPSPRQMAQLARCRAWFAIGVPFERGLLPRLERAFGGLEVVATHEGATSGTLLFRDTVTAAEKSEEGHHHAHDEHAEHSDDHHHDDDEPDPHIWLDPKIASALCRRMASALVEMDPAGADLYGRNLDQLLKDLAALDEDLSQRLQPFAGEDVLVFHPAFGYFCKAYGLHQVAVEVEGKEPGARRLVEIIETARRHGTKVIFVQPQFPDRSARQIARQVGATVKAMDPLARDYPANLHRMADSIADSLKEAE